MANPRQVREFFAAARASLGGDVELTVIKVGKGDRERNGPGR